MADEAKVREDGEEREPDDEQEQQGGGRFNRRLLILVVAVAVTVAVFAVQGIRSAGSTAQRASAQPEDEEAGQGVRDKAEVEELKSRAGPPETPPVATTPSMTIRQFSTHRSRRAAMRSGPKTSTCGRWRRPRWWRPSTAAARSKSRAHKEERARASTPTLRASQA